MTNFDKLKQAAEVILKTAQDNEKLAVSVLLSKLSHHLNKNPGDKTMGQMIVILEKMAANKVGFVRRADFRSLANKLYSTNTEFLSVFESELGTTEYKPKVSYAQASVSYEEKKPSGDLFEALSKGFDKEASIGCSKDFISKSISKIATTLDSWNLSPNKISFAEGNSRFVIVKADYDTPKGLTSVLIPTELIDGKISEATIFFGSEVKELNNKNLKNYIVSKAGSKVSLLAKNILGALDTVVKKEGMCEVDAAILKAKCAGDGSFYDSTGVYVEVPKEPKSQFVYKHDTEKYENQFNSKINHANYAFGNNVEIGRSVIARDLTSFGYRNAQVKVASSSEDTIFYGVVLDGRVSFTVPVKVADKKVIKPAMLLCNGSMLSFDKDTISDMLKSNFSDYKVAAVVSPLFDLSEGELVQTIKMAMDEDNKAKAEDALNVLAQKKNAKAYSIGLDVYKDGLMAKKASSDKKCSFVVTNKGTGSKVCGHTGLPLNKVFQDKFGQCSPLYREKMAENFETTMFNSSRIDESAFGKTAQFNFGDIGNAANSVVQRSKPVAQNQPAKKVRPKTVPEKTDPDQPKVKDQYSLPTYQYYKKSLDDNYRAFAKSLYELFTSALDGKNADVNEDAITSYKLNYDGNVNQGDFDKVLNALKSKPYKPFSDLIASLKTESESQNPNFNNLKKITSDFLKNSKDSYSMGEALQHLRLNSYLIYQLLFVHFREWFNHIARNLENDTAPIPGTNQSYKSLERGYKELSEMYNQVFETRKINENF